MAEPALRHVTCASPRGLHRLAYWEWGERANPRVVICAHGLTRNGRDFDALAERLAGRYRVVCPDMLGRGKSDRASDPSLYAVPQYVADCVTLVARLDVEHVEWVGTSMGGLIGMTLAALRGTPISRLVLNDIGPVIDPKGYKRIGSYVGQGTSFATRAEAENAVRTLTAEFGAHTPEQFQVLTRNYLDERDGRFHFAYDPAISVPFRATMGAPLPNAWPLYDAIRCPTLVVRGAKSDILSPEIAEEMTRRGPRATLAEIPDVGHAPTFIAPSQIDVVDRFLG